MKKLTALLFIVFTLSAHAENWRAPAVMPGCNLPVSITYEKTINGKVKIFEKSVEDVQKEQCREVKNCMNSADDEDMPDLKKLEAVACNNNLKPVTTKVPGNPIDKNFDGKREAKTSDERMPSAVAPVNTKTGTR